MKIIVISDIHGSLFYMNKIKEIIDKSNVDKIVLLGDLYYHGPRNPLTQEYNPQQVANILNSYKDKILCVRGIVMHKLMKCFLNLNLMIM